LLICSHSFSTRRVRGRGKKQSAAIRGLLNTLWQKKIKKKRQEKAASKKRRPILAEQTKRIAAQFKADIGFLLKWHRTMRLFSAKASSTSLEF